jgi:hypothetical protein
VEHDQHWALHEIDEAIRVIKAAASEDGKDLNVHPPVQPEGPVSGRFHRALEAIGNAHRDVADREHNESARGLRTRPSITSTKLTAPSSTRSRPLAGTTKRFYATVSKKKLYGARTGHGPNYWTLHGKEGTMVYQREQHLGRSGQH